MGLINLIMVLRAFQRQTLRIRKQRSIFSWQVSIFKWTHSTLLMADQTGQTTFQHQYRVGVLNLLYYAYLSELSPFIYFGKLKVRYERDTEGRVLLLQ